MPYNTGKYIPGDRKVDCDICGFTYRFSDMRRGVSAGQKGYMVCPEDYDPIHPLDKTPRLRKKPKLPEVR